MTRSAREDGDPREARAPGDARDAPPSDTRGSRTLPHGAVIDGRYRVQGAIGRGGMAVVYEAIHVDLGRVAVKVLLHELCDSAVLRGRFAREARAAVKLEGEHVARVFDTGTIPESGAPYLVMEYLHGHDLRRELSARGPLPVETAVDWTLQACAGLAEAHRHGLVHRDLKPSNLFLSVDGDGMERVKVLDFGIAKASGADEVDMGLTLTGDVFGSPRYMSPEQLRASAHVDARSDVWSLGVVLFELLQGTPPFAGATPPEVHAEVLAGAAPRLERADVPEGLRAAVARCLEKDPARRFAGVVALARALVPFGPAGAAARIARLTGAEAAIESAVVSRDPHTEPVFDEHADTPYTDIGPVRAALDARGAGRVAARTPPAAGSGSPTSQPPIDDGRAAGSPASQPSSFVPSGATVGPRSSDGLALDPRSTGSTVEALAAMQRARRTRALLVGALVLAAPLLYVAVTRSAASTPEPGSSEAAAPLPTGGETTAAPTATIAAQPKATSVDALPPAPPGGEDAASATPKPAARPKATTHAPARKPAAGAPPSLYEDRE